MLVSETIIINSTLDRFRKAKLFQTDVDLCEFITGESQSPIPTGSETVAVLLTLRWCYKLDHECY